MANLTAEQTERLTDLRARNRADLDVNEAADLDRLAALDSLDRSPEVPVPPADLPRELTEAELADLRALRANTRRSAAQETEMERLDAIGVAARDARAPKVEDVREPTPRERLSALSSKGAFPLADPGVRTEAEERDFRILTAQIAEEDRVAALPVRGV